MCSSFDTNQYQCFSGPLKIIFESSNNETSAHTITKYISETLKSMPNMYSMARLPHIYKVLSIKVNEETHKAPIKIYNKSISIFFSVANTHNIYFVVQHSVTRHCTQNDIG